MYLVHVLLLQNPGTPCGAPLPINGYYGCVPVRERRYNRSGDWRFEQGKRATRQDRVARAGICLRRSHGNAGGCRIRQRQNTRGAGAAIHAVIASGLRIRRRLCATVVIRLDVMVLAVVHVLLRRRVADQIARRGRIRLDIEEHNDDEQQYFHVQFALARAPCGALG